MKLSILGILGALGVILAPGSFSQSLTSQAEHEFAAASVRLDKDPYVLRVTGSKQGGPGTSEPGRFTYKQQRLQPIILFAYGLERTPDQLLVPAWLADPQGDRFTITATMPPNTTDEEFHRMLQNLLASRFHLALHHETKTFPGFDLVVATGGPKVKEWVPDPNGAAVPPGKEEQDFPRLQPGQPGFAAGFSTGQRGTVIRLTNRQSMDQFAIRIGPLLNASLGMPGDAPKPRVADKTGLKGIYEFRLTIEQGAAPAAVLPPANEIVDVESGLRGESLFTLLQKQLGLKLVKAKDVPVDVLVIDHMDKAPTEN